MNKLIKLLLKSINFTPTLTPGEYLHYAYRDIKRFIGGILFDIFFRDYRLANLRFTIPYELTNKTFRGRFLWRTYEEREIKYISKLLNPNSSVLELGGCIGVVTCLANSLLTDKRRYVVAEANPYLIPYLMINKNRNNLGFNIENKVVSKDKKVRFFIHQLIVGGSQIRQTDQSVSIPTTTIQQLEKKYKLKFDTLIMDIEGAEKKFIEEFQTDLEHFKTLFIEFHPFQDMLTKKEIRNSEIILNKLGFQRIVKDEIYQIWRKAKKKE